MPQLPLFDIFNRISDFVKNALRVMVVDSSGQQIENFGQVAFSDKIEYDVNGNPIYIGEAEPGTAKSAIGWRIKKLIWSDGNCVDIQWADGNNNFDNVWDDRATYNYS